MFSDSGRYTSFFPQDDPLARANLIRDVPNLDGLDLAGAAVGGAHAAWVKQSLGNALRIIRPIVVLDEGHRTYGELARSTLATVNPSFILELTATPNREFSNILVSVSGRALKEEEMIKLPIRVDIGEKVSWKDTLRRAVDRLNDLEKQARRFQDESGRYIRPIMLVRVERTGKEQRDGQHIHSEDAFEFLTHSASIPPEAIRRQTAEIKELEGDLLSPYSAARVIVTKDALREGWDCPFAYVLAILSRGTARTALTQMIGRILRQPQAARTGVPALDEAHVFCTDVAVAEAVERIRKGLEAEGMGDLGGEVVIDGKRNELEEKTIAIRKRFQGKRIMVPRVLARTADGYRDLDYEADVLRHVDFAAFTYREADTVTLADYDISRHTAVELDIAADERFGLVPSAATLAPAPVSTLNRPALIRRMLEVVPNPWQAARILDEALTSLYQRANEAEIIAARFTLIEHMNRDLQKQMEAATERIFRERVASGDIVFKLLATPFEELNFEFKEVFTAHVAFGDANAPLLHSSGTPLERSLYETAFRKDVNGFEKDVALYLDDRDAVEWWWRIAARGQWGLQGWMRHKVYPDFLVKLDADHETVRLLVLETKGKHLEGSQDTEFKGKLFELLEQAYAAGREAGEVELFAEAPDAMRFRILLQDAAWQVDLEDALS